MRKLAVVALASLILAGAAAAALASPTSPNVTVKATVTPNKAGTRNHPQGVNLAVNFNWQTLGAANQPVVTGFHILFPRGSLYNGARYTQCSLGKLNSLGPSACPKAALMGHGTGTAYADATLTHPKITVVNGGANTIYFYTVLNNPARVQQPVIGHLTRMGGKWAYALSVSVPQDLQNVAGVPIELTSLSVVAGKGSWLATTGCGPGGHWPFSVTTFYDTGGQSSFTDSVPCRN